MTLTGQQPSSCLRMTFFLDFLIHFFISHLVESLHLEWRDSQELIIYFQRVKLTLDSHYMVLWYSLRTRHSPLHQTYQLGPPPVWFRTDQLGIHKRFLHMSKGLGSSLCTVHTWYSSYIDHREELCSHRIPCTVRSSWGWSSCCWPSCS